MFKIEYLLKKEHLKDFLKFSLKKKMKIIIWVSAILLVVGGLCLIMSFVEKEGFAESIELIVLALLLCPFLLLVSKILFERSMKLSNINNAYNVYNFEDEHCESISMVDNIIKSQSTLTYGSFTQVEETPTYFYLFLAPNMAYILPKEAFIEGTPNQFIKFLNSKGIVKKGQ